MTPLLLASLQIVQGARLVTVAGVWRRRRLLSSVTLHGGAHATQLTRGQHATAGQ